MRVASSDQLAHVVDERHGHRVAKRCNEFLLVGLGARIGIDLVAAEQQDVGVPHVRRVELAEHRVGRIEPVAGIGDVVDHHFVVGALGQHWPRAVAQQLPLVEELAERLDQVVAHGRLGHPARSVPAGRLMPDLGPVAHGPTPGCALRTLDDPCTDVVGARIHYLISRMRPSCAMVAMWSPVAENT